MRCITLDPSWLRVIFVAIIGAVRTTCSVAPLAAARRGDESERPSGGHRSAAGYGRAYRLFADGERKRLGAEAGRSGTLRDNAGGTYRTAATSFGSVRRPRSDWRVSDGLRLGSVRRDTAYARFLRRRCRGSWHGRPSQTSRLRYRRRPDNGLTYTFHLKTGYTLRPSGQQRDHVEGYPLRLPAH